MATAPRSPHLHKIVSQGRLLRFKKGDAVPASTENAGIMMVSKGFVKRYLISKSGSLGIQILYGEEDVFSLTRAYQFLLGQSLYDGPETYYYEAMCDTHILAIDAESFKQAIEADPIAYKELFSEAGHHLKSCIHNIENISLPTAYQRVAHQLLFYAREFSKPTDSGLEVLVPLTHQDIANHLGISRETTTLAMVKLRKKGLLAGTQRITVPDLPALTQESYL